MRSNLTVGRILPLVVALIATAMAGGCATMGGEPLNVLSTQQEIALGQQLSREVERQEKVYPDAVLQGYVREIGERLARVSPRQDVAYTFKVIDAPNTVNAFALPGGNMYIYTGLMALCSNEAELAGVMAHEMAHVACHHHGEAMTRQYGLELLTSIALGGNANATVQLAAGLVGQGVQSRFSRAQENEADATGMEMLFRAGYAPDAMVSFMAKLQGEERKKGGANWLPIFASHPPTNERVNTLLTELQRYPNDQRARSPFYEQRYQQNVRARLSPSNHGW